MMRFFRKNWKITWVLVALFLIAGTVIPQQPINIFLPLVQNISGAVGNPGGPLTPTPTLVVAQATDTPTATLGPTATLAPTATLTPTVTPTPTFTLTPTRTATSTRTPRPSATPLPTSAAGDAILLAAGDIARCGASGSAATAKIINKYPTGAVALMGDNAYESGSATEYATCYDPVWGSFIGRTHPAPGNHDFITTGGTGYYGYFGAAAGKPGQGYYSYNLGAWHMIVLNSTCGDAGGCGASSAQGKWLKADLAAHPAVCTMGYWHHPLFSSGEWGDNTSMQPLVQLLYNAGADVMLGGHDHDYERFAPQNPQGGLDTAKGIVQFVAGTGGSNNTPWTIVQPNSIIRQNTDFGILMFTLHATSYDWQFIPVSGSFKDSGTASCH
jgi:acid phosphatase type 7